MALAESTQFRLLHGERVAQLPSARSAALSGRDEKSRFSATAMIDYFRCMGSVKPLVEIALSSTALPTNRELAQSALVTLSSSETPAIRRDAATAIASLSLPPGQPITSFANAGLLEEPLAPTVH
ncbi:hypothetical protein HZC07_05185 [Candidatus Micrarchaeota archaeon]|nr:hypothetical protein [Candidatus Micrarchaeota archaeon]